MSMCMQKMREITQKVSELWPKMSLVYEYWYVDSRSNMVELSWCEGHLMANYYLGLDPITIRSLCNYLFCSTYLIQLLFDYKRGY